MRATSTLTRMGAAAQEQLRGASAMDSRTDEPRRRALHGQHSRANARETEQSGGAATLQHLTLARNDRTEQDKTNKSSKTGKTQNQTHNRRAAAHSQKPRQKAKPTSGKEEQEQEKEE